LIPTELVSSALSSDGLKLENTITCRRARVTAHGHIEPPFAAGPVQRAKVQRQVALVVLAETCREEDDVPLVALDVLEVLHKEALGVFVQRLDDARILGVAQEAFDQGPLLQVERHHPHGRRISGRGLASRYDKLARTYRGGVILRAIFIWLKELGDTP
jgi:hypothetical protein